MSTLTNIIPAQALRGQSVRIYVAPENISIMREEYTPGTVVAIDGTNILGVVESMEYYGNSFLVTPIQPNTAFANVSNYADGAGGYLQSDTTLTVY